MCCGGMKELTINWSCPQSSASKQDCAIGGYVGVRHGGLRGGVMDVSLPFGEKNGFLGFQMQNGAMLVNQTK